jgi:hypothetical protein
VSALTPSSPLVRRVYELYAPCQILVTVTISHLDYPDGAGTPPSEQDFGVPRSREKKIDHGGERHLGTLTSDGFTVWQIMQESLDTVGLEAPMLADQIIGPDGQRWNIIEARHQLMKQVWNCRCERIE